MALWVPLVVVAPAHAGSKYLAMQEKSENTEQSRQVIEKKGKWGQGKRGKALGPSRPGRRVGDSGRDTFRLCRAIHRTISDLRFKIRDSKHMRKMNRLAQRRKGAKTRIQRLQTSRTFSTRPRNVGAGCPGPAVRGR
jgi:hypothetical protein